jgi:hypothetical protein
VWGQEWEGSWKEKEEEEEEEEVTLWHLLNINLHLGEYGGVFGIHFPPCDG